MSDNTIIFGIDPGVTGAIAVMDINNTMIYDMPVITTTNKARKESIVDVREVFKIISRNVKTNCRNVIFLEKTQAMKDSAMTAFSMGMSRMAIIAVSSILAIPFYDVTPQEWKKYFKLNKCDKDASRGVAIKLFPSLHEELKHKKDHNRAEALLIAEYGRITLK